MGGLETGYPQLSGRKRTPRGVRGRIYKSIKSNVQSSLLSASLARTVSERLRSESVWLMKEVK